MRLALMFKTLLAILVFIVVSPIGDALNGFAKAEKGSCWPAAVLSSERMAFICPKGVIVGTVFGYTAPHIKKAGCVSEFLNGIRAQFELKWLLFKARNISMDTVGRLEGRLFLRVSIDGGSLANELKARMPVMFEPPDPNPWCKA
jgi:hypothetical protein